MTERTRKTLSLTPRCGTNTRNNDDTPRSGRNAAGRQRSFGCVDKMISDACTGLDLDDEQMSQAEAFARRLMS